jgi:alanyl-tRNA synthetase
VRVVDIDFSKELCGGTHTERLGKIGLFRIVKESGIAAGVRRIEAVTGSAAEKWMHEEQDLLGKLSTLLKAPLPNLFERTTEILEESKLLAHQLKLFKTKQLKETAKELISKKELIKSIPLLCINAPQIAADEAPILAEELFALLKSGVLIFTYQLLDRCHLMIKVSPDCVQKGVAASKLIKELAPIIGGSGGGKEESAQAGGKDSARIPELFAKARRCLEDLS